MATDLTTRLNLFELLNRIDPKGNPAVIAEVLNKDNPIIQDAPWMEANNVTNHVLTRRLSLPTGSWRRLNQGVDKERSETIKVIESMGMLESYSEVDKALADLAPSKDAFRMSEAIPFLEGMGQTLATTVFYGNAGTDPEQFTGFAPRMGTLDANGLVLGAGGTGSDVTSIYIVQWGEMGVFMIYPRSHPSGGIEHVDLGEDTLLDSNSKPYQGYRDHFKIHAGLAVKNTEAMARYANIESSGTSNTFDEDVLIKLLNRMPMDGAGATIYCNATIKTQMEIKLKDKANVNFTTDNGLGGVPVLRFRGLPVKKCDAILDTETAIS